MHLIDVLKIISHFFLLHKAVESLKKLTRLVFQSRLHPIGIFSTLHCYSHSLILFRFLSPLAQLIGYARDLLRAIPLLR